MMRRVHVMDGTGGPSWLERGTPAPKTNAPLYRRRAGSGEEFTDDRAMDAQMRTVKGRSGQVADPGTSESVDPHTAAAFWWGFGSCAALASGLWALSTLTGAVL